jgi:hypothetical protein
MYAFETVHSCLLSLQYIHERIDCLATLSIISSIAIASAFAAKIPHSTSDQYLGGKFGGEKREGKDPGPVSFSIL